MKLKLLIENPDKNFPPNKIFIYFSDMKKENDYFYKKRFKSEELSEKFRIYWTKKLGIK